MSAKYLLPVVVILLSLSYCAFSECTGCFDNSTGKFLCNGMNCNSFYWPSSSLPLPDGIQCKEIYPRKQCYYGARVNVNSTDMYNFTACNYTMDYCAQCSSDTFCNKCYQGYTFLYGSKCVSCSSQITGCTFCDNYYNCTKCAPKYTLVQNYTRGDVYMNCLACSQAIPGCIDCDSRSSCTQCDLSYMPLNGLCYQKDGKTLVGTLDYQREAANQQTQMNDLLTKIFAALIALCALIFLGIVVICRMGSKLSKNMQKRERSLLSSA